MQCKPPQHNAAEIETGERNFNVRNMRNDFMPLANYISTVASPTKSFSGMYVSPFFTVLGGSPRMASGSLDPS